MLRGKLQIVVLAALALSLAVCGPAVARGGGKAKISATPGEVYKGDVVFVSGRGFGSRKSCVVRLDGSKYLTLRSSRRGRVSFSFDVPLEAMQALEVRVSCRRKTARTTVSVVDGEIVVPSDGNGEDPPDSDEPGDYDEFDD